MTKMTARTIRVDDDLWARASAAADTLGVSLSDIVRQSLRRLAGDGPVLTGLPSNSEEGFSFSNFYNGALVLTPDWEQADPAAHRFHMFGCEMKLRGIDLVISPTGTDETGLRPLGALSIHGNIFSQ